MLSLLFTAMLAAGFWPWPIVLGPYVVVGPLCRHVELKNVDFSIASPPRRRWRSYDITRHLVFPLPPGRHLVSPPNWSLGPYRVIKTD